MKRLPQKEPDEKSLRSEGKQLRYIANRVLDFIILVFLVVSITVMIQSYVVKTVNVDGVSMAPTLKDEEKLLVDLISINFVRPRRFDIVIVDHHLFKEPLVKRVIGLPGETVEIKGGEVYIDGKKLYEGAYWSEPIEHDMEKVFVDEDCIFVLGDNRNHSVDSRHPRVGPITRKSIVGYARMVVWPIRDLKVIH